MKQQPIENPVFIFFFSLFTIFLSIITSVHFLPILLAGILFLGFKKALKHKQYYSLTYLTLAFLFVEFNNGFMPLSLILLSYFLIIFVVPHLTRVVSMYNLNSYIYIFTFYFGVILLWSFTKGFSLQLFFTILFNLITDLMIFGLFL